MWYRSRGSLATEADIAQRGRLGRPDAKIHQYHTEHPIPLLFGQRVDKLCYFARITQYALLRGPEGGSAAWAVLRSERR